MNKIISIQSVNSNEISLLSELRPEGWQDITPHFKFYTKSDFCFPIKIVIDKIIVGIGAVIIHKEVAWMAHIIVHKEYRNQGIGRIITEYLVKIAKSYNCETIYLIATDLGTPVYKKVGFDIETEYLFFKDIQLPEETFISDSIIPYKKEYKNQITMLDQEVSGEDRMLHLEKYLDFGFVFCQDKFITGFYLPTFGEGLIIANSSLSGIELVKLHLKSNKNLVFPKDNVEVINFLHCYDFKEVSIAKRMRLGKERKVKLSCIYNRIGGNIGWKCRTVKSII